MKGYFNVGGCWYARGYEWIAYPYQSFPHGGVFNKLPDFYQDYERERKQAREKKEQRKYAKGFFGFNEDPPKKDNHYPYSVFGLSRSASDDDMKKAYRKSVMKAHPDKGGTPELFRKIREAWDYFKNYLS